MTVASIRLFHTQKTFKVADFIGLFNFERLGQNDVRNIVILVLWRDRENLFETENTQKPIVLRRLPFELFMN